jgi:hypothetical protein
MTVANEAAYKTTMEFKTIEPKILYFGTPVALISSLNEDGTTNLAPMSSFWALGWTLVLGVLDETKLKEKQFRFEKQKFDAADLTLTSIKSGWMSASAKRISTRGGLVTFEMSSPLFGALNVRKARREPVAVEPLLYEGPEFHRESARTTEVSIWRSGTVQYFWSRRVFSSGMTIRKP